jgi:streptogramin lyase
LSVCALALDSPSAFAAAVGQINEFATPTPSSQPEGIVAGPNGNLWFAESAANKIAEINPATGAIGEYPIPNPNSFPLGITIGPEGKIWFTEFLANDIGVIDPVTHTIEELPIPRPATGGPVAIVAGSNGDLWFTESDNPGYIVELSPVTHTFTEFPAPSINVQPFGIAAGPEGDIWFTEKDDPGPVMVNSRIGYLNPATGASGDVSTPTPSSAPNAISAGPDGSLWFTEQAGTASKIGLIDPATHAISEFPTTTGSSGPVVITPGADGNMWFTEGLADKIGVIDPVTRAISEFTIPTPSSGPVGIAAGADGNVWFTESETSKIGLAVTGAPAASVTAPGIVGIPQPADGLSCQGAVWSSWAGLQPSPNQFAFDGYRWLRDGNPIAGAASPSYTVAAADVGHQISCQLTVTYPLLSTTTSAISASVTPTPIISAAPLGATLTSVSTSGATATLTISCAGAPSQVCQGPIALSSHVTTQAGRTKAVAARSSSKPKPRPKVTKLETIASGSYAVAAGQSATVELRLNSTGTKLLDQLYRLAATLTIGGTSSIGGSTVFTYGRLHVSADANWTFTKTFSSVVNLTLSGLPSVSKVTVICHGNGCPFSRRSSSPKHGKLILTSLLEQRHLSPHATVELEITATNDIGEVILFTINSGKQPTRALRCLAPGTRTPAACT